MKKLWFVISTCAVLYGLVGAAHAQSRRGAVYPSDQKFCSVFNGAVLEFAPIEGDAHMRDVIIFPPGEREICRANGDLRCCFNHNEYINGARDHERTLTGSYVVARNVVDSCTEDTGRMILRGPDGREDYHLNCYLNRGESDIDPRRLTNHMRNVSLESIRSLFTRDDTTGRRVRHLRRFFFRRPPPLVAPAAPAPAAVSVPAEEHVAPPASGAAAH